MLKILLTNPKFIKAVSNISDNMLDKYLGPAIREAQDIYLQEIIGTALLDSLKEKVQYHVIDDYPIHKELLEIIQYYLAYRVISQVIMLSGVKIDNLNVAQASDDNLQPLSIKDMTSLSDYYERRADFYCKRIQEFILQYKAQFTELQECDCRRISANLNTAANTAIFLGGRRGRGYNSCKCGRK